MKLLLVTVSVITALLLAPIGVNQIQTITAAQDSSEYININVKENVIPKAKPAPESKEIKIVNVKKTLILEARNSVVFRGPVTGESVGKAMKTLQAMSQELPKTTPIYLILDTPGGSIFDGLDLIDLAKALPQPVHTVTLFAASMGFQFVQNLDKRYIAPNGMLMSHRAALNGLGGQIKGELESRYNMIRRTVDYLDFISAQRMRIPVKQYEQLIFNEYWVAGYDSVEAKAADEEVLIRCGTTLQGSEVVEFDTIFGKVKVTFSKCPLIKTPESVDFSKIFGDNEGSVEKALELLINDKPGFVQKFIVNDKLSTIFR